MKLKHVAVIALAGIVNGMAHASMIGDQALVTFGGTIYAPATAPPAPGTAIIGPGIEFSRSFTDVLNQVWTVNCDFTGNSLNLSWTETTHADGSGHIPAGLGLFTLDFSVGPSSGFGVFTSSIGNVALASFSPTPYPWGISIPGYSQPHLSFITIPTPDSYELQFNALYSGEAYSLSIAQVPEPETYAMMLAGLAMLGLIARRRTPP